MSLALKKSLGARSLFLPEPVLLLCTYDAEDRPNVMTVAWAGVCGNEPPSLQVSVRPGRWTHQAVLLRKAFTVCVPSAAMLEAVDYIGLVSGRRDDKFKACGFTPVKSRLVDAPYIAECPVIMECAFLEAVGLKSHTVILGEVRDMKVDESCLDPTGNFPDITRVSPLVYDDGSVSYFGVGPFLGKAFSAGRAIRDGSRA